MQNDWFQVFCLIYYRWNLRSEQGNHCNLTLSFFLVGRMNWIVHVEKRVKIMQFFFESKTLHSITSNHDVQRNRTILSISRELPSLSISRVYHNMDYWFLWLHQSAIVYDANHWLSKIRYVIIDIIINGSSYDLHWKKKKKIFQRFFFKWLLSNSKEMEWLSIYKWSERKNLTS